MVVACRWGCCLRKTCWSYTDSDDGEDTEDGDFEELKRSEMMLYSDRWSRGSKSEGR